MCVYIYFPNSENNFVAGWIKQLAMNECDTQMNKCFYPLSIWQLNGSMQGLDGSIHMRLDLMDLSGVFRMTMLLKV
jgi:hypothetical protein